MEVSMTAAESPVEVILLDEDDLMHPVEEASNFNESAYYNFELPSSSRISACRRCAIRS